MDNIQTAASINFIKGLTLRELNEMEQVRKELAAINNITQVVSIFNHQEISYIPISLSPRIILIVNVAFKFYITSKIVISFYIVTVIVLQMAHGVMKNPPESRFE